MVNLTQEVIQLAKKKDEEHRKEVSHISYIHIDEFLSKNRIAEPLASSFKVFLRGETYQHSMKDFETKLKEFNNRFKG